MTTPPTAEQPASAPFVEQAPSSKPVAQHAAEPELGSVPTDSEPTWSPTEPRGAHADHSDGVAERAEGDGSEQTDQLPSRRSVSATDRDNGPRRRWLLWGSITAGVVVVAVGAVLWAFLIRGDGGDASDVPATVTETVPVATSTATPAPRGEGSELFTALPAAVRQFILTGISANDSVQGAVEAYGLAYQGTVDDASVTFTMTVGQWATPEEATVAAAALVTAAGTPSSTGEVEVAGAVVGTVTFVGEDATVGDTTDGSATVIWTNGTLVLEATGPATEIHNFYNAYIF
jgi:hypothetical protein